jgi:hypothetical protein
MDPLRFLIVRGERDKECSSNRVLDEVPAKSSSLLGSFLSSLEFVSSPMGIGEEGLIPFSPIQAFSFELNFTIFLEELGWIESGLERWP